ncbi:DNA repair protein RAD10 [Sporobolomyces koalae]|uniref:DNA repair protein RAD10 n=1 Tax=Sporobolomyces koalae TaxID=500713 RepID=UPI003171D43B
MSASPGPSGTTSSANGSAASDAFASTRPRPTPAANASTVARGKYPASTTPVQPSAGSARVVIPGAAPAGRAPSTTGPVSVAAPGGIVRRATQNSILVNVCQKGNPVIQSIRSVPWEWGDVKCDYQVGATTGVLFLSIRYHLLHPEYVHTRIADLGQAYSLRIILVQCDADNHTAAMRELTKICIVNHFTLLVAWSAQEVGRYLETYKQFERKPPDLIRERVDDSYMAHLTSALTCVRGVNKTDVTTLVSNLGSFEKIVTAPASTLSNLPGLGDKKVKRLRDAFTGNFTIKKRRRGNAEKRAEEGSTELN